jgi:hypothetical protein
MIQSDKPVKDDAQRLLTCCFPKRYQEFPIMNRDIITTVKKAARIFSPEKKMLNPVPT